MDKAYSVEPRMAMLPNKRINNTILSNISIYMANHGIEPGAFI
jgi:hypothetical protein